MSFEILSSDKFVVDTLSNDTTLQSLLPNGVTERLHRDLAPTGSQTPYIVFSVASSYDVNCIGDDRAITPTSYTFRVSAPGIGYAALGPITKAIDVAIRKQRGVIINGVEVGGFVRQNPIMFSDQVANDKWYHMGGVYETILSEA